MNSTQTRFPTASAQAPSSERRLQTAQTQKARKDLSQGFCQAGLSEAGATVLQNLGNLLNSLSRSSSRLAVLVAEFRIDALAQAAELMRQNAVTLASFLTHDHRGKQLPEYLAMLASHLHGEQALILKEIGFLHARITHISRMVASRQNHVETRKPAESAPEDPPAEFEV